MRRLLVTGAVLAGALVTGLPSALGASDTILTPTLVGPLRIDHARAADILRFGGKPAGKTRYEIQYGCSLKTMTCKVTYFLFAHGPYKGRLAALVEGDAPRFRTANGLTLGMSKARAVALSPHATLTNMCGAAMLRFVPRHPGTINPYSGLGVVFIKGKVISMHVFSTHVRVTCVKGGFVIHT